MDSVKHKLLSGVVVSTKEFFTNRNGQFIDKAIITVLWQFSFGSLHKNYVFELNNETDASYIGYLGQLVGLEEDKEFELSELKNKKINKRSLGNALHYLSKYKSQ